MTFKNSVSQDCLLINLILFEFLLMSKVSEIDNNANRMLSIFVVLQLLNIKERISKIKEINSFLSILFL